MTWNECPVCLEEFSFDASRNQPKTPILGSLCGHSCCRLCVQSLHEQNNRTKRTTVLNCPICCRSSFRVDHLIPNLGLCDAIENSKKVEAAATTTKRTKHKNQAEQSACVIALLSDDEDDDERKTNVEIGLCDGIENNKKVEAAAAAKTKRTKHNNQAEQSACVIALLSDKDDDDERKENVMNHSRSTTAVAQSVVTHSSNSGHTIDLSEQANISRQGACEILSKLMLRLKSPVWVLSHQFLTYNSAGLGRFESQGGSNIGFLSGPLGFLEDTLRYYCQTGVGEEDDFICQAMVMLLLARIEHGWSASTSVQQLSIWNAKSKPCFSNELNLWQRPINDLITFGGLLESTLSHADNYDSFCHFYPESDGCCSRRSSSSIGYLHLFSEQAVVQWAFCSPQYGNAAAKLIRYLTACDSLKEARIIASRVYRAATTELEREFSSKVSMLV